MEDTYQIVYEDQPEESAWGIIGRGLHAYNMQQAGDNHFQRMCFVLQDEDQAVLGGILCELYWGWLYVDLMWLEEALRGQGYGSRLLIRAEEEARQRGAKHAYLDTFSFQAPDFYQRHGYQVLCELPDFPTGHSRFILTKEL